MPRILYNPDNQQLISWPRQDDEDVVGLQPPVVMLWIEQQQQQPDYDPAIYGLQPTQDVDLDALVLRRGWQLVALPPVAPVAVARWVEFAQALAGDPAVNGLVASCATSAPVLHLMLGVGLGQAAQGDPATFLAAWGQARASGLVSPELVEQVVNLAGGFDLPVEFLAGLD